MRQEVLLARERSPQAPSVLELTLNPLLESFLMAFFILILIVCVWGGVYVWAQVPLEATC